MKRLLGEKPIAGSLAFNGVFYDVEWEKASNAVTFNLSTRPKPSRRDFHASAPRAAETHQSQSAFQVSPGVCFAVQLSLLFDSVIDWSWVSPIMQCVAEPCGQTAVYIRALISIPGEQLQI